MSAVPCNYINDKAQINKNLAGLEALKKQLFAINLNKITKKAIYEVYAAATAFDVFTVGNNNVYLKSNARSDFHKHNEKLLASKALGPTIMNSVKAYGEFADMIKKLIEPTQASILVVECYLNNLMASHQLLKIVAETAPKPAAKKVVLPKFDATMKPPIPGSKAVKTRTIRAARPVKA